MGDQLLTVAGDDAGGLLAAIAFVAGFSEPFFLGTIGRVAGIAEERPDSTATAGESAMPTAGA